MCFKVTRIFQMVYHLPQNSENFDQNVNGNGNFSWTDL